MRKKSPPKWQKEETITMYCEVITYLLETYATNDRIAEKEADIIRFIQPLKKIPIDNVEILQLQALHWGCMYDRYTIKGNFIKMIQDYIHHKMHFFCSSMKQAAVQDILPYATPLLKLPSVPETGKKLMISQRAAVITDEAKRQQRCSLTPMRRQKSIYRTSDTPSSAPKKSILEIKNLQNPSTGRFFTNFSTIVPSRTTSTFRLYLVSCHFSPPYLCLMRSRQTSLKTAAMSTWQLSCQKLIPLQTAGNKALWEFHTKCISLVTV